jgi:hypothetical protein
MNNLLAETYGKDSVLQEIQTELFEELSNIWGGDIQGYGRVQTNPVNSGRGTAEAYATSRVAIPEWYNSDKGDYESVYYDDNYSCVFCFIPDERDDSEDGVVFTNNVRVVFSSDLDKIYPNNSQRLDSKQQVEAVKVLRDLSFGMFEITGIDSRIENIFREFSTGTVKYNNMKKRHVFSVNIKLNYTITNKCN